MKAVQKLVFVLFIFIVSCQSQKQPDAVVKEYLTAIDKFDYKATQQLLVENDTTKMLMKNMEFYEKRMSPEAKKEYLSKQKNYEIKPAEIDGQDARVVVNHKDSEMPITIIFNLKKSDKGWLISNINANY